MTEITPEEVQRINAVTAYLIRTVCRTIADQELKDFAKEMTIVEGVVAGVILYLCSNFNKHPADTVEMLVEGIDERLNQALEGLREEAAKETKQ